MKSFIKDKENIIGDGGLWCHLAAAEDSSRGGGTYVFAESYLVPYTFRLDEDSAQGIRYVVQGATKVTASAPSGGQSKAAVVDSAASSVLRFF